MNEQEDQNNTEKLKNDLINLLGNKRATLNSISAILQPYPIILTQDIFALYPHVLNNMHHNLPGGYRRKESMQEDQRFKLFDQVITTANYSLEEMEEYKTLYLKSQLSPYEQEILAPFLVRVYQGVRKLGLSHYEAVK